MQPTLSCCPFAPAKENTNGRAFGLEWVKLAIGGTLSILAAASDLREYKIKNRLILPFLLIGLVLNTVNGGVGGLQDAAVGLILPLCLLPLFAFKMLGAGDIKTFCALGSIVGWRQSIDVVLYSFIAAGILALGFVIFRKNAATRFKSLIRYLKMCFYNRKLLSYDDFSDSGSRFRFAFAILGGYAVMAFITVKTLIG